MDLQDSLRRPLHTFQITKPQNGSSLQHFLATIQKTAAAETPVAQPALLDFWTTVMMLGVLVGLTILLAIGQFLKRQPESNFDPAIIRNFNKRVITWLTICVLLVMSLLFNKIVTVVLFALISLWALREFITMTPTRRGDHGTLFWLIVGFTPFQYYMVAMNYYDLYTIVIPVYASLFIPGRIAFTGDHKRFLERSAKIQFGLLICVYALSHTPALLYLDLVYWDSEAQKHMPWTGKTAGLLFYFIVVVQVSDSSTSCGTVWQANTSSLRQSIPPKLGKASSVRLAARRSLAC